jgi:hypothetical protein
VEFDRRRATVRFGVAALAAGALVYGVGWRRVTENLAAADLALFLPATVASIAGMLVAAEGVRVALGLPALGPDARLARLAALGGIVAVVTGHPLGSLASALVLFRVATYGTQVLVGGLALYSIDGALR